MAPISRFNFTGGIHTSPGAASPEHCLEALNVFSHQGRCVCRSGMQPLEAVVGSRSTPYVGWGVSADPASVVNSGTATAGALADRLYIGYANTFNRAIVNGLSVAGAAYDSSGAYGYFLNQMVWEYWNGTAWTAFTPGQIWKPKYDATNNSWTSAPYVNKQYSGSTQITDDHINVVFQPPSDWATVAVATQTKYWIRARWAGLTAGLAGATAILASSFVHDTENRILNVLTWKGRNGDPHRFVAYLYADTGRQLRFTLDGVVLTQSAALQPDTTSSKLFSTQTRVYAAYNSATDRVVGCITGHVWFYLSTTDNNIYTLDADPVGTDTPYASLAGGLRGAIPVSDKVSLFDGRYFVAQGEKVIWSEPGVYVDIWPNQNELLLADAYGPITGMAVVGGSLAVFKRNITYVMQSDGSADGYDAVPITGGCGAVGNGVTPCGDFAMLLSDDGMYRFDGAASVKVSSDIDDNFFKANIGSDLSKARGVYYPTLSQWRIFYPSTQESDAFDAAYYVDLEGYTSETQGKEQDGMAIWPQGRYTASDYGFNATALCEDVTTDKRQILLGDRYGVVWIMDQGTTDAGTPVKCKAVQSPENVGHAQQVIVRYVNVTLEDNGSNAITVQLIPGSRPANQRTTSSNPHKSADTSLASLTGVASNTALAISYPMQVTRESNFCVRTRQFSVGFTKTYDGDMEIIGIELEGNEAGRRAEP